MNISGLKRRFLAFREEKEGVAAIEFALILPLLLGMYFGVVEMCNAIEVKRKVDNVANMAGQLVAQATVTNTAYLSNVFEASNMAFEPFSPDTLKVVVTSIQRIQDANDEWHNEVVWSKGYHEAAHPEGNIINPPDGLLDNNRGIIMTEVEYQHTSIFGEYFTGPITFTKTFWAHPRYVPAIPFE